MLEGFLLLTPMLLVWLLVGVAVTTVIGVIPGLGGVFALVMLLPFALTLGPAPAIAMLTGAAAVSGTSNTVTSVLFGVPGSPTGVATVLDGYPMTQRGEGPRAIAAGLTASSVGGVLGGIFLALLLPVVRPIVLALGSPEFAALIVVALILMSTLSDGHRIKSLIAGLSGMMLSFVGLELSTGTQRYTFGQLYLWEGLQLVPVMIGLFAIAEMMHLLRSDAPISDSPGASMSMRQLVDGFRDAFTHWRTTLQSSAVGVGVGLAPGIGADAAQFIAYSQAARTSKRGKEFGTGIVEGVIASDAATNSKDGAGMIPTLAFGIPGSASMAIFLAAMLGVGIQPGASMMSENLPIVWLIIFCLIIAAIVGSFMALPLAAVMTRLTMVRPSAFAPHVLIISVFGSFAATGNIGDILTAFVFGLVGFAMKELGYSRATLVIGFVLGTLLERHLLLSFRLFGWQFLIRPVTLGILIGGTVIILWPLLREYFSRRDPDINRPRRLPTSMN